MSRVLLIYTRFLTAPKAHHKANKCKLDTYSSVEVNDKTSRNFLVVISDEEQPTIESCPDDISNETDHGKPTAMVTWEPPVAYDNIRETPTVTCNPASGSNFTIGQIVVTCEAMDTSGNKATCNFSVKVSGMFTLSYR